MAFLMLAMTGNRLTFRATTMRAVTVGANGAWIGRRLIHIPGCLS
jgi:hypothetical protein